MEHFDSGGNVRVNQHHLERIHRITWDWKHRCRTIRAAIHRPRAYLYNDEVEVCRDLEWHRVCPWSLNPEGHTVLLIPNRPQKRMIPTSESVTFLFNKP